MLVYIAVAVLAAFGVGAYVSHSRFSKKIETLKNTDSIPPSNTEEIQAELDRIEELKNNLWKIRENIENLEIPTPEAVSSNDDTKSSLDKISRFYERYNLQVVGTEQFIMSMLPVSQIGQSLQAMADVLPHNIGSAVFGDALTSLKDGLHPDSAAEFLEKFVQGATHMSQYAMMSAVKSMEHGGYSTLIAAPLKSGAMEAFGANDAMHNVVSSLKDIGGDMSNAAEHCTSVGELASGTDIDVTGHIPVVTLALSSFREFKLLTDDKTDFISSVKNIALDAAGAVVGGTAGAKTGAIVGSFFGPIGTVVGGIIGAICGATGGRYLTNKVKMMPLNNAIEAYETNYHQMQSETENQSKETLSNIRECAEQKKEEFKDNPILTDIPVQDESIESCVVNIAIVLLATVKNEIVNMKHGVEELKKSFWYSSSKHDSLITGYEEQIAELEKQIPSEYDLRDSPVIALETILQLKMPNRDSGVSFQTQVDECKKDLKEMNDKNDSSILMWSYMLNNLYQKTLNDIAEYSNLQMAILNKLFTKWKLRMQTLEADVKTEKNKLGL